MSYTYIISELEKLVASSAWPKTHKTYPDEYKEKIPDQTFMKFGVVLSSAGQFQYAGAKVSGILFVRIFYPALQSKRYAAAIADTVIPLLDRKFLDTQGRIQSDVPSLSFLGNDPSNQTLQRADLSVPFTYRGE